MFPAAFCEFQEEKRVKETRFDIFIFYSLLTLYSLLCSVSLLPPFLSSSRQTNTAEVWADDQNVCVRSCANLNVLNCSSDWASVSPSADKLDVSTHGRIQTETQTSLSVILAHLILALLLAAYFFILYTFKHFLSKFLYFSVFRLCAAKHLNFPSGGSVK